MTVAFSFIVYRPLTQSGSGEVVLGWGTQGHRAAAHQEGNARAQLFLVSYSADITDMSVMRGVLGTAKNFGMTHLKIFAR